MEKFLKNKAEAGILIQDNNKSLIASIELQRVSNSNSEEAKLAATIQAIRCKKYHLRGRFSICY